MRHRRHIPRVLASMVEFVTDLVFDDKGGASSKGLGDNDLDSAVGWHFGFYSRPLDGAVGVVVKAGGEGGTSFLMAYRDGQFEMSLQKGECGMQNAFGASLLLDKNGNIILNGGSTKVALVGDVVNVGTLAVVAPAGTAGGPCTITFTPKNADGTPGTPVAGGSVGAFIANSGGAAKVKA